MNHFGAKTWKISLTGQRDYRWLSRSENWMNLFFSKLQNSICEESPRLVPLTWSYSIWLGIQALLHQKYGIYDEDELRLKMDVVHQEPRQRVQLYYDRLERLFVKGRILDGERQRRFLTILRPKLKNLLMVRTYYDMDELLTIVIKVEKVVGEIKETPYEPLLGRKEELALGKTNIIKHL